MDGDSIGRTGSGGCLTASLVGSLTARDRLANGNGLRLQRTMRSGS